MNIRRIILAVIMVISYCFLSCLSSSVSAENTKRNTRTPSEDVLVRKALSGFVYGIRNKMPGYILPYYKPLLDSAKFCQVWPLSDHLFFISRRVDKSVARSIHRSM